jgi:hypothetical protein
MVYLDSVWSVNGLSVFGDHADPGLFYYLPLVPHLSVSQDGGVALPKLSLLVIRSQTVNGGVLSCDVDLSVPQSVLDDAANQIRQQVHLDAIPRLVPLTVVDGTARIDLLGDVSALPTDPAAKPGTTAVPALFKIHTVCSGKPSLYGDENVTFSAQLDAPSATVIEQTLVGATSLLPIGITYSLDFFALRPAFSVTASIDWNRVQTQFDQRFTTDGLFASSDIDKEIDKLVESQAIKIEADKLYADESDETKTIDAQFDQAIAEARDLVKSTFFQSSILPPKPDAPDDWDKAAKFAGSISRLAVTGGLSAFGGFSYKSVDLTRIDQKSLNFNFSERTTVRKTIWPQGHLGGLFRLVQGGTSIDRFVTHITAEADYFKKRSVQAIARADFAGDSIQAVDVTLHYGGEPMSATLEPGAGKDRQTLEWLSQLAGGTMVRPVSYDYAVTFQNVDRSQRPVTLDTTGLPGVRQTDQDILEIVPRELLYAMADVPIVTDGFPWDRYPNVDVECRYTDEANQIHQDQVFRLNATNQAANFRIFMCDPSRRAFDYKISYYGNHKDPTSFTSDLSMSWVTTTEEQVRVRDPFPATLQLTVVPNLDWTVVKSAFVDLSYQNGPTADDEVDQSFQFDPQTDVSRVFSVHPQDASKRLITYQVTLLKKDGSVVKVPSSTTGDKRLYIRADMKGHRVIGVEPAAVDFASVQVNTVEVDLRYLDAADGLSFNDTFTLASQTAHASFEFDYVDPAHKGCEYKLTTNYTSGLSRETDWAAFDGDSLVVAVA